MKKSIYLLVVGVIFATNSFADTVSEYSESRKNFNDRVNVIKLRMQNKVIPSLNVSKSYDELQDSEFKKISDDLLMVKRGLPTSSETQQYYLDHGSLPPSIFEHNKKVLNQLNSGRN